MLRMPKNEYVENRYRLRILADFHKSQDPDFLNMSAYFLGAYPGDENVNKLLSKALLEPHCGISACSLGWATGIWPTMFEWINEVPTLRGKPCRNAGTHAALDQGAWSESMAEFFGIDTVTVGLLFGAISRTTVQQAELLYAAADGVSYHQLSDKSDRLQRAYSA